MTATEDNLSWNPLPGRLNPEIAAAFATYSLPREISQTNLVFYAFAFFAVNNLTIDLATGNHEFIVLNGFFVFVSIAAASFMRRVLDYRLLNLFVNIVAFLIVSALIAAKASTAPDDWFIYFADLMIMVAITLAVPINFFAKIIYCSVIIGLDAYALTQSGFANDIAAGLMLFLIVSVIFALIIYYKMQQAHFETFLALRREQAINGELRAAEQRIVNLQGLLPVCASCRKVRDDSGAWTELDEYIHKHTDADVSHSICPDCSKELYPGYGESTD